MVGGQRAAIALIAAAILTESRAQGEGMIVDRFLTGNALLQENLSLLTRGEGLILVDGDAFFYNVERIK